MRKFFFFLFLIPCSVFAQTETIVIGKIQDKHTKEELPFVSLGFKGVAGGVTTDFEGRFKLVTTKPVDSLIATYIGYKRYALRIKRGETQQVLIEMVENTSELREAVITPGINPALRIIDAARANRKINNQDNLEAYEYNSYSKTDISLSDVSEEMRKNPIFKPMQSLFDTIHQMRNEEGKHIIPVLVSEAYSRYYFRKDPTKTKEVITANRYKGIGIEKNSYLVDLMGGEFHHYNLSDNFIRILYKDFVSPISDYSHFYYVYTLLDSAVIDGIKTFRIQLNLKRKQDLAFEGQIWIADSSFALKRADLLIGKAANLNFVNRIKLQQEMSPTGKGPWINTKSRVVFDFSRFRKGGTGVVAGFYNHYDSIKVNEPRPPVFFDIPIDHQETDLGEDSAFWELKRSEPLSTIERDMFTKVDSVNKLPAVRTFVDIVETAVNGYKTIGMLDWGPYMNLISYNKIQGTRFRLGFQTNYKFSKHLIYNMYLATGVKDPAIKYRVGLTYVIDPKKWTTIGGFYRDDYDILGISNSPITTIQSNGIFQFFNFFTKNARFNRTQELNLKYVKSFSNNWTVNLLFTNTRFNPVGDFVFAYHNDPEKVNDNSNLTDHFTNTTFGIEARWAYREKWVSRGHDRFRIEDPKLPVFIFTYSRGVKGLLGSDFNYDKVAVAVGHHMNTGVLGTADWNVYAGKIFGTLPYPLLDVARGNESVVYSDFNYTLMNFYEFTSDEFLHATYIQRFEGLLLNKIPGIKTLKLRNILVFKSAWGQLSDQNSNLIAKTNLNGLPVIPARGFTSGPYVEAGYGIDNIFKIFSITGYHRFTYLDLPNVRPWGVALGVRVQF